MTRNPFVNAFAALAYISLVASVMFYGMRNSSPQEDTIIIPIAMISLFTLSAAVMGSIFCLQPIQLYLDGKKKEATNLFVQTIGVFAGITVIALLLLLSGVFS